METEFKVGDYVMCLFEDSKSPVFYKIKSEVRKPSEPTIFTLLPCGELEDYYTAITESLLFIGQRYSKVNKSTINILFKNNL